LIEEKFEAWESGLTNEQKSGIEKKFPERLITSYRAHGISNAEMNGWLFDYLLQLTSRKTISEISVIDAGLHKKSV